MHPCPIASRSAASADVRSRYSVTTVAVVPVDRAWTRRLAWGAFVTRAAHHAVEQHARSGRRPAYRRSSLSCPRSSAVNIFSPPLGMGCFDQLGGRLAAVLGRRPRCTPFGPPLSSSASRRLCDHLSGSRPTLTAWQGVLRSRQRGCPAVARPFGRPGARRPATPGRRWAWGPLFRL